MQSSGAEDDGNLVVLAAVLTFALAFHFGSSFAVVQLLVEPGLVLEPDH